MSTPALCRILIAEDEPNVAASLCATLRLLLGCGFSVQCCASGEDAAALLESGCFDLLITDQRLPGITGLELLKRVRLLHPRLPGVLMTGYGTPEIQADARLLGCPYLAKPFAVGKFVDTVRRTLALGSG